MKKVAQKKHSVDPVKSKSFNSPFDAWYKKNVPREINLRAFTEDIMERAFEKNPNLALTNIVHPNVPMLVDGDEKKLRMLFASILSEAHLKSLTSTFALEVSGGENEGTIDFRFKGAAIATGEHPMEKLRYAFCHEAARVLGGQIESKGEKSTLLLSLPMPKAKKEVSFRERPNFESSRVLVSSPSNDRMRELTKQLKIRGILTTPLPLTQLLDDGNKPAAYDCAVFDALDFDADALKPLRKTLKGLARENIPLAFLNLRDVPELENLAKEVGAKVLTGPIKQSELYSTVAKMLGNVVPEISTVPAPDDEEDVPSGLFSKLGHYLSR